MCLYAMMALGPEVTLSPNESKTRAMGSRRIFPPLFKLQVLDSYRHDHDCKGNQRATARKYNIHRRQIQKWLQCEANLRNAVAETIRQDGGANLSENCAVAAAEQRRPAKMFKHEAKTLKLVAQKLYPSCFPPPTVLKDENSVPINLKGEFIKTSPEIFVPKEYQLNDTPSEASDRNGVIRHKLSMDGASSGGLNLKNYVSGPKLSGVHRVSPSPIQKYSRDSEPKLSSHTEPGSLGVPSSPPSIGALHRGLHYPEPRLPSQVVIPHRQAPFQLHQPSPALRPVPTRPSYSPVLPLTADEPYNLVVKSPAQPVESSTWPSSQILREPSPPTTVIASSPLPARVAEITADSKSSAFSPKRKWLQDSMQDKFLPEPVPPVLSDEPKVKRPCPDFSIERLCGSPAKSIKSEPRTPPLQPESPRDYSYSAPLVFPPPLVLPHRAIPELVSLHFKPDTTIQRAESPEIKEEALSDEDDEPIDVISTTPVENKTFDFGAFANSKRRSFSVQFKLDVLDAFYNDKDCNKNQRATARKFNINRRQVQKWLSLEPELRNEVCKKIVNCVPVIKVDAVCAQCPQHCTTTLPLKVTSSNGRSEPVHGLPLYHGNVFGWGPANPPRLNFVPFYHPYEYPKIY